MMHMFLVLLRDSGFSQAVLQRHSLLLALSVNNRVFKSDAGRYRKPVKGTWMLWKSG